MSDGNETVAFGVFLAHPDAKMQARANPNDAGWDVVSVEDIELAPHERKLVATGVHLKLKPGWEAQMRARSGNAIKLGLSLVNGIGTIDADYTGECKAILLNTGKDIVKLPKGSKIAQLVFKRVPYIELEQLSAMPTNELRGAGGFGSTDKKQ
jgi:dUTP pyrophosphatase